MYLKQADLFWGLNQHFIQMLTAQATRQSHGPGDKVFAAGDRADHFFVLIQGRISLQIGQAAHNVYTTDQMGEVFGWCTLTGLDHYPATCVCEQPTVLLRLDKARVAALLDRDPESALIFYKHLAVTLGQRCMQLYRQMA